MGSGRRFTFGIIIYIQKIEDVENKDKKHINKCFPFRVEHFVSYYLSIGCIFCLEHSTQLS